MDAVKSFNSELSSLYEVKPPISKAKMTAITRGAIKAIKFYKHVVQSVEKFILKCKPEYKVPGLYVIDSIVRQSRHQFGADKDVFAPRFAKNIQQTFINLFKCPAEDKSKIIRVLNLWQKNQVFAPDVIQPLFDLADPNNPIHKELAMTTPIQNNGMNTGGNVAFIKGSPALQKTPTKGSQQGIDGSHLGGANLNLADPNILAQFQQLQRLLTRGGGDSSTKTDGSVYFDKKLLDFDYGDEEDDVNPSPKQLSGPNESVANLLTNPEVLRQLQTLQQTITSSSQEYDMDKLRKLQEMKQQEEEFDKHLAQTVPNLPFAAECEFKPNTAGYYMPSTVQDLSQPPPVYKQQTQQQYDLTQSQNIENDVQYIGTSNNSGDVEVITLDHGDSRSPTPMEERYSGGNRRRRSRSRERSRDRRDRDRRSRRSRSRSRSRRHRSRSKDRNKTKEKESEKDKERKKRGLPTIKKENLSVCSTTLWVGHLSKLVHQEDLSNTFGEFGDIVSIDLIPPRGCAFIVMHRRQDAARCLTKLKNHILHGKAITLAWAPGKGVKGKDLKDYWEGDLGVSYIPWNKLKPDIDLEMLEDGGMIDEDTMPHWMRIKLNALPNAQSNNNIINNNNNNTIDNSTNYLQIAVDNNSNRPLDTSQPPPVPGSSLLQPPPITLPMVSPFQFNSRLLGPVNMNVPPSILPNIPIGVPPPPALMQNLNLGSPFQQGPPNLINQITQISSNTTENNNKRQPQQQQTTPDINDGGGSVTQSFGMLQSISGTSSIQHDDNMDIEMEDAGIGIVLTEKTERQPLLSEQLEASLAYNNNNNNINNRRNNDEDLRRNDDRIDNKNRRNSSLNRDRDRDRIGRFNDDFICRNNDDNNRRNRRKDDRRERTNRWEHHDEHIERNERRDREKTLNDRLQQMANESSFTSTNHDNRSSSLPLQIRDDLHPPGLLDRRIFPPMINSELDDIMYVDDYDPMNGPSQLSQSIDDYPSSQMIDDFQNPLTHHRMQHRHDDVYEQERYIRLSGRRDYRDSRIRGPPPPPPPPPPPDFYPIPSNRDVGYGIDGGLRPMMRPGHGPGPGLNPDFNSPRMPMMRSMGPPHKFHPRGCPGPLLRGPRPNNPWKDRQNFGGPRFDHQSDFYRGPNQPPHYDDLPPQHLRHRSGRYDDKRRSSQQKQDYHDVLTNINENSNEPSQNQRYNENKRNSRWGDSSPKQDNSSNIEPPPSLIMPEQQTINDNEQTELQHLNVNIINKVNSIDGDGGGSGDEGGCGSNTPLHDEPLNREQNDDIVQCANNNNNNNNESIVVHNNENITNKDNDTENQEILK